MKKEDKKFKVKIHFKDDPFAEDRLNKVYDFLFKRDDPFKDDPFKNNPFNK
jgi:hypothetical protein